MPIDPEFYDFARHEISRRGDRALAHVKAQRDYFRRIFPDDMSSDGETFWTHLIAAIEEIERDHPSPAIPDCLLCGDAAEETVFLPDGGLQQHCAECGLFRVNGHLWAQWQTNPEACQMTTALQAYLADCAQRGEIPVLSEITLARINRG